MSPVETTPEASVEFLPVGPGPIGSEGAVRTKNVSSPNDVGARHAPPSHWLVLAALTALCAGVGAVGLDRSIWYDEAFSLGMSRIPTPEFWEVSWRQELNMVGHYLFLRGWNRLGSDNDLIAHARLLSLMCTVCLVPIIHQIGLRLFGARAALFAAVIAAIHPALIEYSSEARAYALVALLIAATGLALVCAIETDRRPAWAAAALLGAVAVYAHLYALLALAAFGLSVLAVRPLRGRWIIHALACAIGLTVLLVPMGVFLWRAPTGQIGWIAHQPDDAVQRSLLFLSGDYGGRLALPASLALILGTCAWLRRLALSGRTLASWRYLFAVCWATLPTLFAAIVSEFQPILVPRYVLLSTPGLVLLGSALISRIPAKWLQFGVLLLIVGSLAGPTARASVYQGRERWDELADFIRMNAGPADGLIVTPSFQRMPLEYYLAEDTGSLPIAISPGGPWGTMPLNGGGQPDIDEFLLTTPRVWLVVGTTQPGLDPQVGQFRRLLSSTGYRPGQRYEFGEVALWLYES